MAYNEFGIYEPRDPDLDQMRLALAKQPSLASQIPGSDVKAPAPDRPLDRAELNFKSVAANLNPLMMMKTLQDVAKTTVINPLLMPASIAVEAAQGTPARQITGSKFYQAPITPMGQAFERDLGKAMEAAKIPHAFPVAPRPAGMRPAITPNDVRVMGAEATRMARGIKDIPTDFANAQSGFTRIDPVTNQPTYGARLGQADRDVTQAGMRLEKGLEPIVTDIMGRGGTSADLLAAMAGQPSYAVRPKGTRLVTPTRTSSDTEFEYATDPAGSILKREFTAPYATDITPTDLQGIVEGAQAKMPNAEGINEAFAEYTAQRISEMFPDAPSQYAAENAFNNRYADSTTRAQMSLQMLDDFLQTPEGQATGMARPAELEQRHQAAMKWLTGPFSNYIERNVGTEGDPLVKLASQGFTMMPSEELRGEQVNRIGLTMKAREAGGYPVGGSFERLLDAKERELTAARNEVRELETRRAELAAAARAQGLEDPARLPAYAELTNPLRAKAAQRDKLQKELENLQTGAAYEDITDSALLVSPAKKQQQGIDYAQRQFYPTLMQTPPTELTYRGSPNIMQDAGIGMIASKFYDDVMSGKIPLDKVEKTTVENFVRKKSEERIKAESEKKLKEAQYITNVENRLRGVLQTTVPNDMTFGNAAVILLDENTPQDVAIARVSEDTAILDHCVGQGGSASRSVINPFTGKEQRYEPIIDPATGQRNPKSSQSSTGYVNDLGNGHQLASIRSLETGRPVATLQFYRSHLGNNGQQMYRIGYASGYANGDIDPTYSASIRDYLNSRADNISSAGDNLAQHAQVYDAQSPDDLRRLERKTKLPRVDINDALDNLPRFVLPDDVVKAVQGLATTQQQSLSTGAQGMRETDPLTGNTRDAVTSVFSTAINMLDDRAARVLNGLWSDIRDLYLTPDATIADLRAIRIRLENAETFHANRGTGDSDVVAETISEVLLPEINGMLERRAQPNADFLGLFEPEPDHPANLPAPAQAPRIDYVGLRDRLIDVTAREEGADIAAAVSEAVRELQDAIDPQQDPLAFAVALRDVANTQDSMSTELALYDLADSIETAHSQQVAVELFEMGRNPDGTLNRADLLDTATALSTGQLDHPAYRDIPAGPAREAAMQGVLENFNNRVAAALRMPQLMPADDLTQMTRHQLVQSIDPNRWPLINARSDLATVAAQQDPDPAGFLAALRSGQLPDFTNGLNMYEREAIAQDVRDVLFMQGAQAPAQAPEPAPEPIAPRLVVPGRIRSQDTVALSNNMPTENLAAVVHLARQINEVNDREDLPRISYLVRNHVMGEWDNFGHSQREVLARMIDQHYENTAPVRDAARVRDEAIAIGNTLDEVYFADAEAEGAGAVPMIRNYIRNLDVDSLTDLLGMASDDYDITPQLVEAVRQELEQYLARYEGRAPEGYQAGGSVKKDDSNRDLGDSARKMLSLDTPESMTAGETAADIAAGFIPGVGTMQAMRDFERARREGDRVGMALASAAMVPIVGGMVKPAKAAAKALPEVKEHVMLQGLYRGYAGEQQPAAREFFLTPQKRVADFYAKKRSAQTGAEPHADMVLVPQNAGEVYGHGTIGMPEWGFPTPMFTNARRKIAPTDIKGRTQLYAEGGSAKAEHAQIPDQAFINKAHGGIVNQNPSVEQMRFEIMMRGK